MEKALAFEICIGHPLLGPGDFQVETWALVAAIVAQPLTEPCQKLQKRSATRDPVCLITLDTFKGSKS